MWLRARRRARVASAAVACVVALLGCAAATPAGAASKVCPRANPTPTGPCGETFTLPGWGDAGGWTEGSRYETIQLADVDGDGRADLLGRDANGLAVHVFDRDHGTWRPQVDREDRAVRLRELADPAPLVEGAQLVDTDWRGAQHYDTIQAADVDGDGAAEIVARATTGIVVHGHDGGGWRRLAARGPMADADPGGWADGPWAYATIQLGDLDGDRRVELIGRAGAGVRVWRWTGGAWAEVTDPARPSGVFADAQGFRSPSRWPSVQLADVDGDGRDEVVGRYADGIAAYDLVGRTLVRADAAPAGRGGPFSSTPGPDCPFPTPEGQRCLDERGSYWTTIQFADLTGDGRAEALARTGTGLRVWTLGADRRWRALAQLGALSDAGGFLQQSRWETIQTADLDGDGRRELVARTAAGVGVWSLSADGGAWTQLRAPSALALADDPWGRDRSYWATIQAGDVDGDGRADLIARGPYGIRTWFLGRDGAAGWGTSLEDGYPDFATAGRRAAMDALTAAAKATRVIPAGAASVRSVWAGRNEPAASDLEELRDGLLRIGRCSEPRREANPQLFGRCTPPEGSSGFTPADWTAVVNQLLAERFFALQVVEHFAELRQVRQALFIEQGAKLPALADDLGIGVADGEEGAFDLKEFISGGFGLAGALFDELPGAGVALEIAGELIAMIPSSSRSLTAEFRGTYAELRRRLADSVAETDVALRVHSWLVRRSQPLLTLVGELRARGTWTIDQAGMESAGRYAFTLGVYRAFLPVIYDRYVVTACEPAPGVGCRGPPDGTPGRWGTARDFAVIGPPTGHGMPCEARTHGGGVAEWLCQYHALPGELGAHLWDRLGERCGFDPDNGRTAWTYDCGLGLDPRSTIAAADWAPHWGVRTHHGNPVVRPSAGVGGQVVDAGEDAARLRLRLAATVPRKIDLDGARVAVAQLLHDPRADAELAPLRAPPAPLRPAAAAARGRTGAAVRVRRTGPRRLLVDVRVRRGAVALPAQCSGMRTGVDFLTTPFTLQHRLRVETAGGRAVRLPLRSQWRCIRARDGAVRLRMLQSRRRAPTRGGLRLRVRAPRTVAAGRRVALTVRLRNRARRPAYGAWVRATAGAGRLSRPGRRAGRGAGARQASWAPRDVRARRARTLRLRLRVPRGASRACVWVVAGAALTRPASRRVCVSVGHPRRG